MSYELKDWLNSINFNKNNLIEDDRSAINDYNPYIVNKILSGSIDCLMYVNEMNIYNTLDKELQYEFYLNVIRKKKRYTPIVKKQDDENISLVQAYYNYSEQKAKEAIKLLSKEQLEKIKNSLSKGGLLAKSTIKNSK